MWYLKEISVLYCIVTIQHEIFAVSDATTELARGGPALVCTALLVLVISLGLIIYRLIQHKTDAPHAAPQAAGPDTSQTVGSRLQANFVLQRELAQGRWGGVWKASLGGEVVSVKLFSSHAIEEFRNEHGFFSTAQNRHANVVRFIAAGEGVVDGRKGHQLWLITEYCPQGSLQDYLTSRVLSWGQTVVLLYGISSGLSFLHADSLPDDKATKVSFAHRDLKSSNVLVKQNGTCVLADFDSAAALDNSLAGRKRQVTQYLR